MAASDTVPNEGSSRHCKEEWLQDKEVPKSGNPATVSSETELASDSSLTVDDSTISEDAPVESKFSFVEKGEVKTSDSSDDVSRQTPSEVQRILESTKEAVKASRIQNEQEIMALQKRLTTLEGKLKKKLGFTSMAIYTKAMRDGTLPVPTYVLTHQTQLCRALHVHEIYLDQIERMQKRNKRIINHLKHQIEDLREESERRKQPLQEAIDSKRDEVVRMCHTIGLDPDDWAPRGNMLKRISSAFNVFNEWMASGGSN